MPAQSTGYLLGYSDHERRRLALQAAVLNPLTEGFLVRAGLGPGMRVLDLGCGVGEVALIAARLVAPRGHVTAIDVDAAALEISRARASAAGMAHLSFEQVNVVEHHAPQPYDAVIGRHILIHTPDPFAVLRQAAAQVHPGGIVAFQEYDLSRAYPHTPAKPLFEKTFQSLIDLFTRAAHADIGVRLFQMFHDAGLTHVQSRAEFLLDGGADCPFYEWIAETTRSLVPKLEALGIATANEIDADTLSDRLKQEALTVGGCVASPVMIGTYGRRPS
ncbi:MAG TPA: class I SAM-dependent methyltransferase [Bryobacteraceae bacterium]|jgi:ubiquinone/menaquinone biosynthesis C-methylase UbiE